MSIFKKYFLTFILIFISYNYSYSQPDREQVGNENLLNISGGAFYNYAQKNKVNIEVNIWGYVKNPGKYLVPKGVTVQGLISYAGGPLVDANLDEIRLYSIPVLLLKRFFASPTSVWILISEKDIGFWMYDNAP